MSGSDKALPGQDWFHEATPIDIAKEIALQLGPMIADAEKAGHQMLAYLLETARNEARKAAGP